jgi:hypothetical protein
MKLKLEGQNACIRLGEAELDLLLAGEALAACTATPFGTWRWQLMLGEDQLLDLASGVWTLTLPDESFRVFAAERPRRDGFSLALAVADAAPLQLSVEVDVRESRRRQLAGVISG